MATVAGLGGNGGLKINEGRWRSGHWHGREGEGRVECVPHRHGQRETPGTLWLLCRTVEIGGEGSGGDTVHWRRGGKRGGVGVRLSRAMQRRRAWGGGLVAGKACGRWRRWSIGSLPREAGEEREEGGMGSGRVGRGRR
jgi:hypothetical protein